MSKVTNSKKKALTFYKKKIMIFAVNGSDQELEVTI